ncbi:MAG: hypothetical protein ABIT04_11700 [Novosphingobium sp.]
MNDPTLFAAGALFTQDYLSEGIGNTAAYASIDVAVVRQRLGAILAGLPHSSRPNEATTETDFVWPVLQLLGWGDYLTQQNLSATGRVDVPDGLLFIDAKAKAKANAHPEEWKRYQFGAAIIESKRLGRALDRAEGRKGDDKDTPSTQLLRYLRRIDDLTNGDLRWGLLTNGAKWRLYFSGARSTIDDYLELDLARIMGLNPDLLDTGITDRERDHWLAVFVAMFGRAAFERASDKAPSFHDTARREAAFYEERVAKNLSDLVFNRLYPALGKAVAKSAKSDTPLDDIRQATLILLYRLLFVLYAEDRGLLPVKDPRFDDYALRVARLDVGRRKDAGDSFSTVAKTIWNRFADLAEMIDKGDPSVGLPPYNGGLFNGENTPLLKTIALSDDVMAEALDILSFEQRAGQRRYINYRDLSVQQLGSIYERLLEFELIRDEAGSVDVRPNIFARKNSGSYYTPDDLVLLILDETLAPLIQDAMDGFTAALANRDKRHDEERQLFELQKADPAKAITRLRICDPAMGSGHFLVSLVDRLTNHTLDAIAEASAMTRDLAGLEYESPVAEEIRKVRGTIRHNAIDASWTVSEEQLDDPQLVKRMVLKRCVYGADKNPMAVELAKVALWLHTFTVGAPLSFIDHHLAAGDSLFGLWVRDAIDKAGKGGELLYVEELRTAERQAAVMQRIEALTDAEIAEVQDSADMWRDVAFQTGPLDSFVSFMHALDWLDLKGPDRALVSLWLDGQFGDPLPIARGKKAPEGGKAKAEAVERFTGIWQAARDLIREERFLNWQITFPGVWTNWASAPDSQGRREGGFDAVVGNPPWDRIKLQQVEWFAARRPEIARAQKASDRARMIKALKGGDDPLFADYEKADRRAADTLRIARNSGHYPLLSRGDINLYSLFVERAHALVRRGGMVGLLTPSGIASDLSASEFFRKVATGGHLKALYDFENRKVFFPDVHASFKFCVIAFSPGRSFGAANCAFYLHSVDERKNPEQAFPITAAGFARVNPNTGTAPIFRTRRDMALTTVIYERLPVLVDKSGTAPVAAWRVKYTRMFDMTNDSHLFRTKAELEGKEGAWPVGGNRWRSAASEWVPLYEGKMVQAYDHRAAGIVVNLENVKRPAQPFETTIEQHKNPAWVPDPQFWVARVDLSPKGSWHLGMKHVTSVTNMRSMIVGFVPECGAGNSLPIIDAYGDASDAALLAGSMNSIAFDFVLRQKVQGQNLNWFIVEQLPVVPPAAYARTFGPKSAADIVRAAVLELTYTAHDMAPFARDMGHVEAAGPNAGNVLPPFVWDEERRLHLRAKLDALYFILYGVYDPAKPEASRDDIRYIYSTFPIVERQEIAAHGRYRSRDLALAYINALMAGQPDAEVKG